MQNWSVGVASKKSRWHAKLHAFYKQLVDGAPRMYACKQISEADLESHKKWVAEDQQKGSVALQRHSRLIIKTCCSHILR